MVKIEVLEEMWVLVKKILNAAKSPEQSKGLGGNIGCKDGLGNDFVGVLSPSKLAQHGSGKIPGLSVFCSRYLSMILVPQFATCSLRFYYLLSC